MRKALASGLRSLAGASAGAQGSASEADAPPQPDRTAATADADEPVFVSDEKLEEDADVKDESKRGRANDCCALCTEPFTPWGSSLNLGSLVRKAPPRRTKHMCRICARPVCESDSADVPGCCTKARVPKRLWHRSLASLRKEDTKVRRLDCTVCFRSKDAPAPAAADPEDYDDREEKEGVDSESTPAPEGCSCGVR